jgi:hypothetical protein
MIFVLFPPSSLEIMGAYCGAYKRCAAVLCQSVWYRAIFKFHTSGHLQLRVRPIARLNTRRTGSPTRSGRKYCIRIINIYEIRQNDGASGEPCGMRKRDDE